MDAKQASHKLASIGISGQSPTPIEGPTAPHPQSIPHRIGSGALPWWAYATAGTLSLGSSLLLATGSSALSPKVGAVPQMGSNLLQLGAIGLWLAAPPFLLVGALEGLPPRGGPWASATTGGVVGILGAFLSLRAFGQLPPSGEGLGLPAMLGLSLGQTVGTFGAYGLWLQLSPQSRDLDELSPMLLAPEPFWVPWRFRDRPLNW